MSTQCTGMQRDPLKVSDLCEAQESLAADIEKWDSLCLASTLHSLLAH